MSTFAMEFELIVGNQETNFLEKRFNAGSNTSITYALIIV